MRKFLTTLPFEIQFFGLAQTANELTNICLEKEISLRHFGGVLDLDWKVVSAPLGKSNLEVKVTIHLNVRERFVSFLFGDLFYQNKKMKLITFLSKHLDFEDRSAEPKPFWFKKWNSLLDLFRVPKKIYLQNLREVNAKLNTNHPEEWEDGWSLAVQGEMELKFRIGYLQRIEYLFYSKRFKAPYPHFAECYVREKNKLNKSLYGETREKFRGFLLQNPSDEYLLPYWKLNPTLPHEIRNLISESLWYYDSNQIERNLYLISLHEMEERVFSPAGLVSTF